MSARYTGSQDKLELLERLQPQSPYHKLRTWTPSNTRATTTKGQTRLGRVRVPTSKCAKLRVVACPGKPVPGTRVGLALPHGHLRLVSDLCTICAATGTI